jgi:cell division protein ZapE
LNLREAYENSLNRGGHDRDPAQEAIVTELIQLQQRLERSSQRKRSFFDLLSGKAAASNKPVRGLYIWGGVGRGKTFLMDLFFETLQVEAKKRIHFHRLLQDVRHCRGDPGAVLR